VVDASSCDLVTVEHGDGGEGSVTTGTVAARQPRPGAPAPTAGQPRLQCHQRAACRTRRWMLRG